TTAAGLAIGLFAFFKAVDVGTFQTIVRVPWVPMLGMEYHLAVDGISLTLVLVTGLTAVSAVLFSWNVERRPNEFFFWLLLVVGGPRLVPRVRCSCGYLADAHLGAHRSCRRAHRRLHVAGWHRHEIGRLRRAARGHESFSARVPNVESMDRYSRRHRNCLRCGG